MGFAEDPAPGNVDAVVAFTDDLRARAEWFRERSAVLERSAAELFPLSWSGLAAEVVRQRLETVRDAASIAASHHQEAGDAAQAWVEAMRAAQLDADRALVEAEDAEREIAIAEAAVVALGADHAMLLEALAGVQRAFSRYTAETAPPATRVPTVNELSAARRRAEDADIQLVHARHQLEAAQDRLELARELARRAQADYERAQETFSYRLDATKNGRLQHTSSSALHDFQSGVTALATIEKTRGANASASMALLNLTPGQLAALLADDAGVVQQLWDHPPAPDAVSGWWRSLDRASREKYITSVPGIVGNLAGIPYADRNTANWISYTEAKNDPHLSPDERKVIEKMGTALAAPAKNIPVQIVAFNFFSQPPMLAVGYGDLDTCTPTTWCVGGMSFGAKDALEDWSKSSKNLWSAQKRLGVAAPGVVACLEYDNPDAVGVTSSDSAKKGAARFAAELDGNASVRTAFDAMPSPISVTAHSYGTTMAAIALTRVKTPIDAFVMVGSAGIDTSVVPSLSAIQAGHVYTTAATRDQLAPLGAAASGRANPNPGVTLPWGESIGGAQAFSSDGDGKNLQPVDGHNPLGKPEKSPLGWVANTEPSNGHGYYDLKTQSLWNMAAVTTGKLEKVSGPLTITTQDAATHNEQARYTLERLTWETGLGR